MFDFFFYLCMKRRIFCRWLERIWPHLVHGIQAIISLVGLLIDRNLQFVDPHPRTAGALSDFLHMKCYLKLIDLRYEFDDVRILSSILFNSHQDR